MEAEETLAFECPRPFFGTFKICKRFFCFSRSSSDLRNEVLTIINILSHFHLSSQVTSFPSCLDKSPWVLFATSYFHDVIEWWVGSECSRLISHWFGIPFDSTLLNLAEGLKLVEQQDLEDEAMEQNHHRRKIFSFHCRGGMVRVLAGMFESYGNLRFDREDSIWIY